MTRTIRKYLVASFHAVIVDTDGEDDSRQSKYDHARSQLLQFKKEERTMPVEKERKGTERNEK